MIKKIQLDLLDNNVDGLWITDTHSINYLIGVNLNVMERFVGLLIEPVGEPILVVNQLFTVKPEKHFRLHQIIDADDIKSIISNLMHGRVIGVDKKMNAEILLGLIEENPHMTFEVGSNFVDRYRAIKSSEQIELLKEASRLNDQVMKMIPHYLTIGVREIEVADHIKRLFIEFGADGLSFEPIVAFGENCADPHAVASNRKLKDNETIIIDIGCIKDGYCSDMTRTFILGKNQLMKEVYDLVNRANKEAISSIKPHMTFSELDAVARTIIKDGGYVSEFNHRLGHGIGQEIHEPYDVSASNHAVIEPGMCFSIEPGVYLEGLGGVRIENLVYIDEDGRGQLLNFVNQEDPFL